MNRALLAIAGLMSVLTAACNGTETPEDRVRAYVDRVAASTASRSWPAFNDYVAESYADPHGLGKDEVLALITRYILANRRIHVLKRVAEIRVDDDHRAHAVVYAAMAGVPVDSAQDLAGVNADIYRFAIDLVAGEDGAFRVVRGDWRPAGVEEFLIGR